MCKTEYFKHFQVLNKRGNFDYNILVLKGEQPAGTLVPVRRSATPRPDDAYLPCPNCYGFFVKKELWRHTHRCGVTLRRSKGQATEKSGRPIEDMDNEELRDYKVSTTANAKLVLTSVMTSKKDLDNYVSKYIYDLLL